MRCMTACACLLILKIESDHDFVFFIYHALGLFSQLKLEYGSDCITIFNLFVFYVKVSRY